MVTNWLNWVIQSARHVIYRRRGTVTKTYQPTPVSHYLLTQYNLIVTHESCAPTYVLESHPSTLRRSFSQHPQTSLITSGLWALKRHIFASRFTNRWLKSTQAGKDNEGKVRRGWRKNAGYKMNPRNGTQFSKEFRTRWFRIIKDYSVTDFLTLHIRKCANFH